MIWPGRERCTVSFPIVRLHDMDFRFLFETDTF